MASGGTPFVVAMGCEGRTPFARPPRQPATFLGVPPPVKPCDRNILQTLKLVEEMIALADQGDADREDVGCGILYGMLRDTAYKLKRMAEDEKRSHQEKGWWPVES